MIAERVANVERGGLEGKVWWDEDSEGVWVELEISGVTVRLEYQEFAKFSDGVEAGRVYVTEEAE